MADEMEKPFSCSLLRFFNYLIYLIKIKEEPFINTSSAFTIRANKCACVCNLETCLRAFLA
uniref:Uncharacterized protein n=1 Tax=Rhizophora mucronata TaxID=61149 RepID=A0A2P2LRE5_RHIMU